LVSVVGGKNPLNWTFSGGKYATLSEFTERISNSVNFIYSLTCPLQSRGGSQENVGSLKTPFIIKVGKAHRHLYSTLNYYMMTLMD